MQRIIAGKVSYTKHTANETKEADDDMSKGNDMRCSAHSQFCFEHFKEIQ